MSATEVRPELLQVINETPALISVLYDCNLLPEQVTGNRDRVAVLEIVVAAFICGRDSVQPSVTQWSDDCHDDAERAMVHAAIGHELGKIQKARQRRGL